ncbi:hypothetical protein MTF65_22330 [Streptomyces sp. APSN-46.1]|uniref:hypothetical protein n=1 Tax=Streptomyces sp. APSN-46.1 TaxID=2929049 RepID=UPI001FB2950C|nr:hypothetical protein [Streptomyces sp. APSN-46.1]MCJ1680030.1 hypothetical protein [Streptomyces sp. APSN-46.1]
MIHTSDVCPHPDFERLRRYLSEFVERRIAPVHTAVAFNAVYFGFDTEAGGYAGGPLDIGEFPYVALGDQVEALPVGAMINIRTGGDLLPAEVVYKEGAHPAVGSTGDTPGWLSGAPLGAQGPGEQVSLETPNLRERLVFDAQAFGQGLAATSERLSRLSRRGTTDAYGHLIVEARYAVAEGDLDDTAYYARYLMTRGWDQLASSLVPMPLPLMLPPTSAPKETEAALFRLMCVVRQALASSPELRMWGDYAFTRTSMAARLADPGPLGRDALASLAQSVGRSAAPIGHRRAAARNKVVYTALGPALRALPRSSASLRGTAYPLAVSHANVLMADYVRGEADEQTGLLPNGVHLAQDDPWQSGGVWRAEYRADESPAATCPEVPQTPSGRGWAESRSPAAPSPQLESSEPDTAVAAVSAPTAGDGELWPGDHGLGDPVRGPVRRDRALWTQPMRSRDLSGGYLPLPQDVLAGLALVGAPSEARGAHVQLSLTHDGQDLPPFQATQDALLDEEGRLTGLEWPADFFPGILLTLTWPRAGRVIQARTVLLPLPQTVDGEPVAHRYDRRVRTRDGGSPARQYAANRTIPGAAPNAESLVMTAVRRLGLLDVYGRALLARDRLHAAIHLVMTDVPLHPAAPQVAAALVRLLASGHLTLARGSRSGNGRTHYPQRPREAAIELVCYTPLVVEARPRGSDHPDLNVPPSRVVNGHHVPGFLRYIGHLGYEASEEQRRLFRQDFLTFGLAGTPELPQGYTYVRPHRRGT